MACGVGGLILAGLWGLTDHEMAYRNENLFQVNPLALLLPALVVPWLRGGAASARRLGAVALVLAAVSLLGWVLQATPWLNQVNGPVIALALPVHLGIAAALGRGR
jgi:hypothetical protein